MRGLRRVVSLAKRKVPRCGRQEKNEPKVSLEHLQHALAEIMERHGVCFASPSSEGMWGKYWALYKDLLMLAPTMAILTKSPVSIYGVGSFRVNETKSGRKRFRARFSPMVARFLSSGFESSGNYERDFWKVFGEISKNVSGEDSSVTEAVSKLSFGEEEL